MAALKSIKANCKAIRKKVAQTSVMPSDMRALLHSGEASTQHTIDPSLPQHKRMKSDWLAEGSRVVSSRPRGVKELRARPHGDASTGRRVPLVAVVSRL